MGNRLLDEHLGYLQKQFSGKRGNHFFVNLCFFEFFRLGKIAVRQNRINDFCALHRSNHILNDLPSHFLHAYFVQILVEGDHLEIFPEAGEGHLGSPGDVPLPGQELFVKDIGDVENPSFYQGLRKSFFITFFQGIRESRFAHEVDKVIEFRPRHGRFKG